MKELKKANNVLQNSRDKKKLFPYLPKIFKFNRIRKLMFDKTK
jgi:hypothetical protein